MPQYSTISRIQTPSLSDRPDVESATLPPAAGVERACLMPFADSDTRDAAIISPTEGLMCYIEDEDDIQIFTEGLWKSAGPRFIQLYTTNIPGTTPITIDTFNVRGNSRYQLRYIVHTTQSTGTLGIYVTVASSTTENTFNLEDGTSTGTNNITVGEYIFDTDGDAVATVYGVRSTGTGSGSIQYGTIQLWKVA